MTSLRHRLRDFIDIFSPRYCAVCGCRLNTTERILCAGCRMRLPYMRIDDFYDNPISRLFWAKIPVEKAASFIHYKHDSDSHLLLMQLKYNHRPDIGRSMGEVMAQDLQRRGFFQDIDAIVPIPLHWKRFWKRGYNQSMQLAMGINKVTRIPILGKAVRRVRNNESQTSKSFQERMENVDDLFEAKPITPYRHILIVDDVLTTSATMLACAKALLDKNPDISISILTLAKA